MRKAQLVLLLALVVAAAVCCCVVPASAVGWTERVSVSSNDEPGNGDSSFGAITPDGRFVAFASGATNLVPGDTNGVGDVFVHDRWTGTTELVSVTSTGEQGHGGYGSYGSAITPDGRFVAFHSDCTDLVPGDTGDWDVFVHDRQTGVTELVSVSSAGEQGNDFSGGPSITPDGRFIAFNSGATNLVPGDTNGVYDVFVHDRQTGVTERVSVSSAGEQGNDESAAMYAISADGQRIMFRSDATNLVPDDTNGQGDHFVHDRQTGVTERVTVSSTGAQQEGWSAGEFGISADGRYVVFDSTASNLVPGDTGDWDVFVHDCQTGVTELVSVSSTGEKGNSWSGFDSCAISAGGRFVVFDSNATNLVSGDTNGQPDVFVRDRQTGTTELLTLSYDGSQPNDTVVSASISADGRAIAFDHTATNLVPGDTNGKQDVFVRVRWRFRDVPPEQWAFSQVEACVNANVVKGYSDETYRPSEPVTRDQMAVYIARGLVAPSGDAAIPDPPETATFSDVPTDYWAYKYIEYCVANNIVVGYAVDNTYRPGEKVNRGQMAAYVARAIYTPRGIPPDDLPGYTPPADPRFPDVPTDHPFYKYVEYIAGADVVQGYGDGTYRPTTIVNRGQMAVYVARAFALPM
jgi:Tol biopolymer transport system component